MKIKNYKLGAVIPTVQYGNIQPVIETEGEDLDEMKEFCLDHIKELHSRFSDQELKDTIQSINESVKLKSFNEDIEVDFDKKNHVYKYNNQILQSGSVYASNFYKKFDSANIAKNCEKSWGVGAEEITDMWSSNGSLSSEFGTVIHKALEHYFKHVNTAKTIANNIDDKENRALPKHPVLRSIISDFVRIDKTKAEEYQMEVLVTDVKNLNCGVIDRLAIIDQKKKICRIQDYKVNVNPEEESNDLKPKAPFDTLPANKLTKYQIQLSFYAEVLKNSGWTIDGLDVFVYENQWKHYPIEVLEIK